jgi:hypothetical protein
MITVGEFLIGLWVPSAVQFLVLVGIRLVESGLCTRGTWTRDVSVEMDEVEERRDLGMRGIQCGEMISERRNKAAFICSSGRLR